MINGHLDDCSQRGKPIGDDEHCAECGPTRKKQEAGRKGGAKTSRRKSKAVKRNGARGGRPRKAGGPSDVAQKLGISRQHANSLIKRGAVKSFAKNRRA